MDTLLADIGELTTEKLDQVFEEDLRHNPYTLRSWVRYLQHKLQTCHETEAIYDAFERSLAELPGSYKLWHQYLQFRTQKTFELRPGCAEYERLNDCYRNALVYMNRMPRIWIMYLTNLVSQRRVTDSRRAFNQALRELPSAQHGRIWPLYLKFLHMYDLSETTIRTYRRYLKYAPDDAEQFVDYLRSIDQLDEAAKWLSKILNDQNFVSKEGNTRYELWNELCELIAQNPGKVTSLKIEPIVRQAIGRFTDQVGALWCTLADYYIRDGKFERARDIYEEAMQSVHTVRDFTQIFDAYAQFMEHLLTAAVENEQDSESTVEVDLQMARFEDLMDRRALLVNSVLLRQNPHNVHEWLKRVELAKRKGDRKALETFEEAVATVQPKMQIGRLADIWAAYCRHHEEMNRYAQAIECFERARQVEFAKPDELAVIYCCWAEMELRQKNFQKAIDLLKDCLQKPQRRTHYHDQTEPVQNRIYKSLRLWTFLADLEENFGTFKSCKAVYDTLLDLRIATPQLVINYATFLEQHNYFEESFKAFEKGVALFPWPNVSPIWSTYLLKFLKRYAGSKLERARDLFEQCLEKCPPKYASKIYLLYAKLEEDYGLGRNAMAIYQRAVAAVATDEKNDVFKIYIKRTSDLYGITNTRPIYEQAIQALPEAEARQMCLRFANMERKLGEIDRARAIYGYCSQMCNPRVHTGFWDIWKEFEVKHGNEDTVREMLRIKRSVAALLNNDVCFVPAKSTVAAESSTEPVLDSMSGLEAQATETAAPDKLVEQMSSISFVKGESIANKPMLPSTVNPDEIDLDEEQEPEEPAKHVTVEKLAVPSEVFGSLVTEDDDDM